MTATQVFLRFIQTQYTNPDGTINKRMAKLWRNIIRRHTFSSKIKPKPIRNTYYSWLTPRVILCKDFVDHRLNIVNGTLRGYMTRFLYFRPDDNLPRNYAPTVNEGCTKIRHKWYKFLEEHIVEQDLLKIRWRADSNYKFTWREYKEENVDTQ